ncbi:hypothetical protein [Kribbella speibonae]|uniref:Ubiquitin-like domain-containing protein n=1 Tax=Kribbella speibonae TaxID=1572660 RepID=A0A4R0IIJ0_9ACTN|nr:hypothetical protein [Kribbella speibonae]TCC33223.1 hypothetical protein E0H92_34325 [Kribbella speibonae]
MSTEAKPDEQGGNSGHDHDVVVTIAAPNNASRAFEVDLHDRVDKVAREAVRIFVRAHEMEQMECSLVLIVDGTASTLDDAARLEEAGVRKHSRLALVPKQPKTDG